MTEGQGASPYDLANAIKARIDGDKNRLNVTLQSIGLEAFRVEVRLDDNPDKGVDVTLTMTNDGQMDATFFSVNRNRKRSVAREVVPPQESPSVISRRIKRLMA